MNYEQASALLSKARKPEDGKKIANNTRLFRRDLGAIALRLHSTDIVTFHPDGRIELDSSGWRTVTTKRRMNEYTPARISSKRGQWYLADDKLFADGVTYHPDGTVTGYGTPDADIRERKLRKEIAQYARGYIAALYDGKIPAPSGGDCWGCLMKTEEANDRTSHGPLGGDHIREHMRENYYVPSLLWRAFDALGASEAEKNDAAKLMKLPGHEAAVLYCRNGGFIRTGMEKALRRYCLRELGMAH